MKLTTTAFICCMLCTVLAYAAEPQLVQQFEFGVNAGLTVPLGGYHGGDLSGSVTLGLELRYNVEDMPWDCGLILQTDGATRHYKMEDGSKGYTSQTNATWAYGVTGAYNFRQGHRINPFIGAAVCIGSYDQEGDGTRKNVTPGETLVFMPRAGIELFHHIRLTTHCMIVRHGFHTAGLAIGFVIGGRPKKKE